MAGTRARGESRRRAAGTGLAFAACLVLAPSTAPGATPAPGRVAERLASGAADCACAAPWAREALAGQRRRIAAAGSVEAARKLALAGANDARSALGRVRWMAPGGEIERVHGELVAYERRVAAAAHPAAVADAFASLTRLTPASGPDVDCHYTTLEIVAIVLGFILGIIPGLILLVLLC